MKTQWMLILILTLSNSVLAAPSKPAPRKPKEGQNEAAIRHHKEGLRHRDAAWVYEEKMSGIEEGEDREKYAQFIQDLYNRALGEFAKATGAGLPPITRHLAVWDTSSAKPGIWTEQWRRTIAH